MVSNKNRSFLDSHHFAAHLFSVKMISIKYVLVWIHVIDNTQSCVGVGGIKSMWLYQHYASTMINR